MKFNAPTLLSTLLLLSIAACDMDERTITDPAEMVEKGIALFNRHAYGRAKPLFEKAIRLLDQQGKTSLELEAYDYTIKSQIELGEFSSAVGQLDAARRVAKKAGEFRAEVAFSLDEGDAYARVGILSKAVSAYASARQLASTFNDVSRALTADLRTANTLLWNGRVREANDCYQALHQREQENASPAVRAEILLGIGRIFRLNRQFVEASNSLAHALESADAGEQPLLRARILHELGCVHFDQRAINEAVTNYRDAVNVLRRARERREYEVLFLYRIGESYLQMGRSGDAQKYFGDAMELAKVVGDRIAENYLSFWNLRANVASMVLDQRLRTFPRLVQSYEQIASRFRDCGHRTGEGLVLTELGTALQQSGDRLRANEAFQQALRAQAASGWDCFDAELHRPYLESFGLTNSKQEWVNAAANSLLSLDRPAEALRVAELGRVREQSAQLEELEISFRHPALKERAKELRAELQEQRLFAAEVAAKLGNRFLLANEADALRIQARLTERTAALQKKVETIVAQHVNYAPLFPMDQAPLNDLQQFIPRGSTVVDFIFAQDRLAIFAITRAQMIVKYSAIGRDSLLQLVHAYQQLLNDPSVFAASASAADVPAMTRFSQLSTRLYDLLIRPLDELQEKNLIIVANSAFGSFPFHALERQERNTVRYVIEARSVDYLPSLTSLKFRTTTTSRIRDIVAFGNPTGKQWSVDYELRDVRSFFKNARIHIGLETSWNNLRSAVGDVVQISTEFTEPTSTAPLGAMMLSNGLMVEESESIAFEKLMEQSPTAVAVLSNQSAQGSTLQSIHALILRINGTADVFMNSWTADRKAAKFFSEYFYTALSNGLAPGDAYRQALISLIRTREVSHPHSWAQFFHFGIG